MTSRLSGSYPNVCFFTLLESVQPKMEPSAQISTLKLNLFVYQQKLVAIPPLDPVGFVKFLFEKSPFPAWNILEIPESASFISGLQIVRFMLIWWHAKMSRLNRFRSRYTISNEWRCTSPFVNRQRSFMIRQFQCSNMYVLLP